MKGTSRLTPAEVYHLHCKLANACARKFILSGVAGRVLSDFKTLHVAITRYPSSVRRTRLGRRWLGEYGVWSGFPSIDTQE